MSDPADTLQEEVHRQLTGLLDGELGAVPDEIGMFTRDLVDTMAHLYLADGAPGETDGLAALVSAGPPGAGKSTALAKLGLRRTYRRIDPDEIRAKMLTLLEQQNMLAVRHTFTLADGGPVRPHELSSWVHRAATDAADIVRRECLSRRENFIMDGTLNWAPLADIYPEELALSGYQHLTVLDIEVDLGTALRQARHRWWVGRCDPDDLLGGRFVPDRNIASLYGDNVLSRCATTAHALWEAATDYGLQVVLAAQSRLPGTGLYQVEINERRQVGPWPGGDAAARLGLACRVCGSPSQAYQRVSRGLCADCDVTA